MKPHIRSPRSSSMNGGFSLIEVMVVIAILSTILAVAGPNFIEWVRNTRISSQANDIVADMLYARSEAAARGKQAIFCPSTDSSACSGDNNWAGQRVVRITNLGTSTASIPRISGGLSGSSILTALDSSGNPVNSITFSPYGSILLLSTGNTLPLTFTLCPSSGKNGRTISLGANGRPAIERITCL